MRGVPKVFLLLAAGALLAGCAELSAPPSLQASFEESSAAAASGGQITATLKVTSSNYSGQIRLTLVEPAGFTLMEPTAPVPITATEQRVAVRVAVGGTVPPASYTLRFRVDAQGLPPAFATLPVMVQASTPSPGAVSFSAPTSLSLFVGQDAEYAIAVTNGTASEITVEAQLLSVGSALTVTPSLREDAVAARSETVLRFSLRPNAEGTGELVFRVRAFQGSVLVQSREVRATYTAVRYGVFFEGADFRGLASDEAAPPASATLSYRASGGFRGLVLLQAQAPGWTLAPTSLRVDQDSGTFNATLTPPPGTGPGTYTVPIRVEGYDFQDTFTAQVTLSGFTVSLASPNLVLAPTAVLQGSITPLPGFPSGALFTLSLEGPDAGRFTLGANAFSVGNFSTSLSALPGTPPGSYSVVLRVTAAGAVRKLPLNLTVQAAGLAASVEPPSFTAYAGGTASLTLQLTSQGGFGGWVLLGVRDPATGAAVPWAYVEPGAVYLNPGATQTFTVTLNLAPSAPVGVRSLQLVVYGPQVQALPITVNVQEPTFQIALSTTSFTIAPGASATATLSVTTQGPFTAPITLTLAGTGAGQFAITPSSLDPSVPVYGLVLTASTTATPGAYNLVLTASGGGVTRTVPITVTVP